MTWTGKTAGPRCWAASVGDSLMRFRCVALRSIGVVGRAFRSAWPRLFAVMLAVMCGGCGGSSTKAGEHPPRLLTVRLQVGETRRFTAKELPAGSVIACTYRKNRYRYVVPLWSSWDPTLHYGWFGDGARGTGEGWLGVRPEHQAKILVASCSR